MFDFTILLSGIIFVLLDYVYLSFIKNYFEKQIYSIQGSKVKINLLGAVLCYLFLIIGLNYFIIKPKKSISDAFLLGLIIYGVYETTNFSLLSKWSFVTVIIDTLWGGILFALTVYIVNMVKKFFKFTS
jgi:uncharacterized membrane protein